MNTIEVRRDLQRLGIAYEDYRVLMLLPLVYVAWADGRMETVEVHRIVWLARQRFGIGDSGIRLLERWLAAPPSREYIQRGMMDLLSLARAPEVLEISLADLQDLLLHAEAIARTTAAALDAPWAVGPAEEQALDDIARVLGIDNGISWATLLRELDENRRAFPPPPPRDRYAPSRITA
jgi:hypothetical protein